MEMLITIQCKLSKLLITLAVNVQYLFLFSVRQNRGLYSHEKFKPT